MRTTTIIAPALFLLFVLVVVALLTKSERKRSVYELYLGLLSQAEKAFYRALVAAVSEPYVIAPKVRVADVLKVAGSSQRKGQTAVFNKIAMKHFDFVLCDPPTLVLAGAIELDDHNRSPK